MSTLGKVSKVVLMVAAATASLAPSAFSSDGFRSREARCVTCCAEENSRCIAFGISYVGYYLPEIGSGCGDTAPAPPP
jgi:hypothetical protein